MSVGYMHEMYTEIILDYYRNPKNFGRLENPDASARDLNPLCGDEIEMQMKLDKGTVKDVRFAGKGCAISQAAASMLAEFAKGKGIAEANKISQEDVLKLLNIPISAARRKCAMLGLKVFKIALYGYQGKKYSDEL